MKAAQTPFLSQPLKSIAIIGDGLRAALPAAYLAARCGISGTRITVVPSGSASKEQDEVVMRPNIRHLHQLLKIPENHILGPAQGRRLYAIDVESENSNLSLPFGNYGEPYKGIAFTHIIKRLHGDNPTKALSEYNLNLALHAMGQAAPFIKQADFGYVFPRHLYTGMLSHYAAQLGVQMSRASYKALHRGETGRVNAVETQGMKIDTDCVIVTAPEIMDATQLTAWEGNCLYLPPDMALLGNETYRLQSAMERMNAFMPDQNFNAYELGEFNRLSRLEDDRISDMVTLLRRGFESPKVSAALKRKIDVFAQRDRIPKEDYEVFTSFEWRAALMGVGFVSRNYDRLADGHSVIELQSHVDKVYSNMRSLLKHASMKTVARHD